MNTITRGCLSRRTMRWNRVFTWMAVIHVGAAMARCCAAEPAAQFTGNTAESVWLPGEAVARKWEQYVKTGGTEDTTPPPAPTNVKAVAKADGVELTWDTEADFESGLTAFLIERDGQPLAQHPEKPQNKFGRPLFQDMNYGDTPVAPLLDFRFTDKTAKAGEKHEHRVKAVNSAGLKSAASRAQPFPESRPS